MQSINNNLKNIKDSKKRKIVAECVCVSTTVGQNKHTPQKKTKLIKIKARTTTYLIKESK